MQPLSPDLRDVSLLQTPVSARPEEEVAYLPFTAEGEFADREGQIAGRFDGLEVPGNDAKCPFVVLTAFEHDYGVLAAKVIRVGPELVLQVADAQQAGAVDVFRLIQMKGQLTGTRIGAVADR